jgi:hypothetical protein
MKWRSAAAHTTGPKEQQRQQQQAGERALLLLLVWMLQLAVTGCSQHQLLAGVMPAGQKEAGQMWQATADAVAAMAVGMQRLQEQGDTAARQLLQGRSVQQQHLVLLGWGTAGLCLGAGLAAAAVAVDLRALEDRPMLLLLLLPVVLAVGWIHKPRWMTC